MACFANIAFIAYVIYVIANMMASSSKRFQSCNVIPRSTQRRGAVAFCDKAYVFLASAMADSQTREKKGTWKGATVEMLLQCHVQKFWNDTRDETVELVVGMYSRHHQELSAALRTKQMQMRMLI